MPLLPVALYGLEVPAGDIITPALPDFPATFRITMAAIDPSAPSNDDDVRPRATLKLLRQPIGYSSDDESEEDSEDERYMREILAGSDSDSDEEEDEEDDEVNGGPSDPAKSKKARKAAALKELMAAISGDSDDDDDEDDDDEDMKDAPNGVNGTAKIDKKGKAKATDEDEDDLDEDEGSDEDEDDLEIEEFVICTLDLEKTYQQPLDITIGEDERVYFKVSGTHAIHLTGNYVVPDDNGHNHHHEVYDSDSDEEDEEYDLTPDEDELDLELEEDESDDLDNLDDPRVTEVDSEEEVPKLTSKAEKKGKNKRVAEDEPEAEITLDELMAKSLKPAEATSNGEVKLSKKQLKKLKKNNGEAVTTKAEEDKKEVKKDSIAKDSPAIKGDKKVQFAKNLEQGPTGSSPDLKTTSQPDKPEKKAKTELGVKTIKGVTIDDKKIGAGPAAKKGDRLGIRYIGKLQDGKVFDSNKKGKPFTFKIGAGEVISGLDIGVSGMSVGGERRVTIPAALGYGSKPQPAIPSNSTLIFDVKVLEIK